MSAVQMLSSSEEVKATLAKFASTAIPCAGARAFAGMEQFADGTQALPRADEVYHLMANIPDDPRLDPDVRTRVHDAMMQSWRVVEV